MVEPHWQLVSAEARSQDLAELLADGWEPFAVTWGLGTDYVWLRRQVEDRAAIAQRMLVTAGFHPERAERIVQEASAQDEDPIQAAGLHISSAGGH